MFFVILVLLGCVAGLMFCISLYIKYRESSTFTGSDVEDSLFGKFCIKFFTPRGTNKINLDLYLYTLNKNWTLNQFSIIRGISALLGVFISISIIGTMVFTDIMHLYDVSSDVPLQFNNGDYSILVEGLHFNGSEEDLALLKSNVALVTDEGLKTKLQTTSTENIYSYVKTLRKRQFAIYNPLYLLLLSSIIFVFYNLPFWILRFIYRSLAFNKKIEFDDLDTHIQILAESPIAVLLDSLVVDSLFFKNQLIDFSIAYERHSEYAYDCVEHSIELHPDFKRLIGHLRMIELNGPEYVRTTIAATKEQTLAAMKDNQERLADKRKQRINLLCSLIFLIGISRLMIMMLRMFLV